MSHASKKESEFALPSHFKVLPRLVDRPEWALPAIADRAAFWSVSSSGRSTVAPVGTQRLMLPGCATSFPEPERVVRMLKRRLTIEEEAIATEKSPSSVLGAAPLATPGRLPPVKSWM